MTHLVVYSHTEVWVLFSAKNSDSGYWLFYVLPLVRLSTYHLYTHAHIHTHVLTPCMHIGTHSASVRSGLCLLPFFWPPESFPILKKIFQYNHQQQRQARIAQALWTRLHLRCEIQGNNKQARAVESSVLDSPCSLCVWTALFRTPPTELQTWAQLSCIMLTLHVAGKP